MMQIRSNDRAVRRRATGLAAALVAATLVSACGGGDRSQLPVASPGTDAPVTTEVAPPVTDSPPDPAAEAAWIELTSRISDEGEVDLQTAIDAFSMTIAPLPGASTTATGGPQLDSATGPVQWLSRHLDQLTPEQRAIVSTALTPAGMESASTAPGGSFGGSFVRSAVPEPPEDEPYTGCFGETPIFRDSTEMGEFRSILDGAYLALAEHLGTLGSIPYIALTEDEVAPNVKAISMPFNIDCIEAGADLHHLADQEGSRPGGQGAVLDPRPRVGPLLSGNRRFDRADAGDGAVAHGGLRELGRRDGRRGQRSARSRHALARLPGPSGEGHVRTVVRRHRVLRAHGRDGDRPMEAVHADGEGRWQRGRVVARRRHR